MKRSPIPVLLLLVAGAFGACGGSGDDVAGPSFDDVRSATIDFRVAGQSIDGDGVSKPVGFHLQGPFSFDGDGRYPVMRLDYTRLLAGDEAESTVTSTGEHVFVETGGRTVEVPPAQLEGMRMRGGDSGGLEELRVDEWVDGARTEERGGDEVTTGKVDVARAIADLGAMARQLGLPDDVPRYDDRAVRDSEITVVTDADSGTVHELDLRIDFVGARLTVHLALTGVNDPVKGRAGP